MRKRNSPVILENLTISAYAAEGKSLGRQDGKVVFVEGVVPGDVVDVRLLKNKKDWAEGIPVRFRELSPDRVDPFCRHFGICGGCQWQMLPYEKQLAYKEQQVIDALSRIGKVPLPAIEAIAGCEQTRYYRNKLEYTFGTKRFIPAAEFGNMSAEERLAVADAGTAGYHARGMFDKLVQIETCHLQPEPTNQLRNEIAGFARENGWPFYDIREHRGWLRTMQVRMTRQGDTMVNIMLGSDVPERTEALMQFVSGRFPQVSTLLYTINPKKNDSLQGLEPTVWKGSGWVTETLGGFRFKIGPKSFFQTNSHQAEVLYGIAREMASLDGAQTIYDLYCGTGSIGIFCSAGARKVIGVELVEEAVSDARENARENGVGHAAFFSGDVVDICNDDFFREHGRPDVVITDPPRAGMHAKLVEKLLEMEAPVVIYVSCNPSTQARDIAMLAEKYRVDRVKPVDMFPHTLHIETVVKLVLKGEKL